MLITGVAGALLAFAGVFAQQAPAPSLATSSAPNSANTSPAVVTRTAVAADGTELVQLSPFEVSAAQDRGYLATSTLSGTRLNSKLEDLAASLSVVTKQQLLDTAATDINDVFMYEANTEGIYQFTSFTVDRGNVSDDVAANPQGATRVRGLTAANTTLEGERAELTRKRDELAAQLTDANSKKDGAEAALASTKEELVKATEKAAGMFTKEQLAESETKATAAEEKSNLIRGKYAALHAKVSRAMENNPAPFGFPSDPLGEPAKPGDVAPAVAAVEAASESILTNVLALDSDSGIVAFSVGEANGIKEKAVFDVKIAGKKVGKVQISTVKGVLSFGQLQPDKELDIRAISKASSVSLVPSTKLALN